MIVECNWGNFSAKFRGREKGAFEWLCSLLFYKEHHVPTGALRYFNQAGIEAEPISVGDDLIGWQAKHIDTDISRYEEALITAIDTAKNRHPKINRIFFYINLDFGQGKRGPDPMYKSRIDNHALSKGVTITWKTASFFESPFVCELNANIARHFFEFEASVLDFVAEIRKHSDSVMESIRSHIELNGKAIKINRSSQVEAVVGALNEAQVLLVSGDGGVGKTALIRDYREKINADRLPFYVFKATEFNVQGITQFFSEFGPYSLKDFVNEHTDFESKYIVVDSAEKLADAERPEVFQEILQTLKSTGWKIIFTTRLGYLEDLKYALIELYKAEFETINISPLSHEEVKELADQHDFALPTDERILRLLENPFYLKEYLRTYPLGNSEASYTNFRDALWNNQIIRSSIRRKNVHRQREECFRDLAFRRASSGRFYVDANGFDEALNSLESDEIVKFDAKHNGYFITHDIYEEWALERVIERAHLSSEDVNDFYQTIGDSLAIRRAFRSWLSEKLASDLEVTTLIQQTVSSTSVSNHWKDEAIVAAMLSNYAATFIKQFENSLLGCLTPESAKRKSSSANYIDGNFLYRLIFLLRIACKEVDPMRLKLLKGAAGGDRISEFITRPRGPGWGKLIGFFLRHQDRVGLFNYLTLIPFLHDWVRDEKNGEVTKNAGLVALRIYSELTKGDDFPYSARSEIGRQLVEVILSSSAMIKSELSQLLSNISADPESISHGPHELLAKAVLSSADKSATVALSLPLPVIELAKAAWSYSPDPEGKSWRGSSSDIETVFGLDTYRFDHQPSSAFQTPILMLLRAAPRETVTFILEFVNQATEKYVLSRLDNETLEVDLFDVNGDPLGRQYASDRLWLMHRGGQPAPALLESIHMALERWLIEVVKEIPEEDGVYWCMRLIKHSRSASITSVVASATRAAPEKLFKVAAALFRTREFFRLDLRRQAFERSCKGLYSIGFDRSGIFQQERLATCEDRYRQQSLENQVLNYQLFSNAGVEENEISSRQDIVWGILDEYYEALNSSTESEDEEKIWRLALARMDSREMDIKTEVVDDEVRFTFNPRLDQDLREFSEESFARVNKSFRFLPLQLWASSRWEKKDTDYARYAQYEAAPQNAYLDALEIARISREESDSEDFNLMNRAVVPTTCAVLLRDFPSTLDDEQKELCRTGLLEFVSRPLKENYEYQVGDGMDVAISSLPLIAQSNPESKSEVGIFLLLSLFDEHPIGGSEKFRDRVVRVINAQIRPHDPAFADHLFLGYLFLQPKYRATCDDLFKERKKENKYGFGHDKAIQRFLQTYEEEIGQFANGNLQFNKVVSKLQLEISDLVTALELMPNDPESSQYKEFTIKVANLIVGKHGKGRRDANSVDYLTRHGFLTKFAEIVLTAKEGDIADYLKPVIENFGEIDYLEDFFKEFIFAQDRLKRNGNFWSVWHELYPAVVSACMGNRRSGQAVSSYLFASVRWNAEIKEWHSVTDDQKVFFETVGNDIGTHPVVLESLAALLNGIGSRFQTDGLFWISNILLRIEPWCEATLERNTQFHLENFVRGYVLRNRQAIRTSLKRRKATLVLLDFLVEQGSVTAYLTRDYLL